MPTPTASVKVNPLTGALIDPIASTFASANGFLTGGTSDAKESVVCATTANGTLATAFENGDTVDGIVLATGNRILIKNQSAPAENGIYTVNASGAPTRATDFDSWTEIVGAFVSVESGTVNAGTQWLCNVVSLGTLNTTAITFVVPKNFVDLTTAQNIAGLKTFTSGLNTTGATSEISTSGANAYIKTTGAYAVISTEGEYGVINTIGASASIQTSGLDATIFTTGANAHIFTYNAGAYIQTRSTFKLFGGTYTTTISHAATANRALALPDASGTLLSTADLGTGVGTFLATPSGANLASALTTPLPVGAGGTGVSTSGTTSQIAVGGGTGSAIVWTTATGTGSPVRAGSPTFSGTIVLPPATAAPTSLMAAVSGDPDTGLWAHNATANMLAIVAGGQQAAQFGYDGTNTYFGPAGTNIYRNVTTGESWINMQAYSLATFGMRIGDPTAKIYARAAASQTANIFEWQNSAGAVLASIDKGGNPSFPKTITAAATTGAQTIDKASGSVNFAAAATSLVVTNSLCTTSSVIHCTIATNDATAAGVKVVAAAGSFTIYLGTAPTAETRVNFLLTN